MIFALFAIAGVVVTVAAAPGTPSMSFLLAAVLFGALFLGCVLTKVVRGRV